MKWSTDRVQSNTKVLHIPTHIDGGTLDLVISDVASNSTITTPEVIKLGTNSDHYYVSAILSGFIPIGHNTQCKIIDYRKFDEIDVDSFREDLNASELTDISNFTSLDHAIHLMERVLSSLLDKHCPLITRSIKVKCTGANWFDNDLRNLRAKRRAAERRKRKHDTPENRMNYLEIQCKFNKLVWQKKKSFYEKSLGASIDNKRALFNKIKRLMGTEVHQLPRCTDEQELAEQFKTFFDTKVNTIRQNIMSERSTLSHSNVQPPPEEPEANCELSCFDVWTEDSIKDLVMAMPDKFCSLDPIPTWLLKKCLPELTPVLCYIINESLKSGQFPQRLKHAIVKPILRITIWIMIYAAVTDLSVI